MTYPHWNRTPQNELDWFEALINLARYLRGPDGCPWDREQTALSFAQYARKENDELIEALEKANNDNSEEEMGDTLFVLLASIACAEVEGRFSMQSVMERVHEKMIRRHDHVFGENKAQTAEEAIAAWDRVKREEGRR
ncbi:MAG TPA: MazG nucleotide pyrophosphohydrolase domain-containing protein [Candidatus Hydrogenedentes bacterium]|nr:MazG nucleotide pyrophosphohydrolase domain-containing protein [Candidatus Hydrogenedentota bacterium]HRK35683.1 MazG nucleotide pyrophosphohydrolase domain-containing protein [Candidatus Hydrogenedentota bacterium]